MKLIAVIPARRYMNLIGVIPARTGSKRLPNKNFKEFFSKPIISYPLAECVASEIFDKIVISTDNPETTKFLIYGESTLVQVHKRSSELINDITTVDEVCLDVLKEYPDYDYLCCVYPTAYAVTWQSLCQSFSSMIKQGFDASCSFGMLNGSDYNLDNGGFYWIKVDRFLECKTLMPIHLGYELPMVDINTIYDFAEAKIHALSLGERFK